MTEFAIHLINGFVWGAIIALIALGLSLIFGLVGIINIAHGELYMLGAVSAVFLIAWTGSFWIALIISPIIIGVFGLYIERYILRRIEKEPSLTLIATFGLSMILQYLVLWGFGGAPRRINDPINTLISIGSINYPLYRIIVALISIVSFIFFFIFLKKFRYGLWIRSVGQNPDLAASLGIPVERIYWIVFGVGSGFAALAGVLAAPIVAVEFKMGSDILVLAFMASILGGLGNFKGTFIAGVLIGELESLLSIPLDPTYAHIGALVIICIILVIRPQGIFRLKEIIT